MKRSEQGVRGKLRWKLGLGAGKEGQGGKRGYFFWQEAKRNGWPSGKADGLGERVYGVERYLNG
jgi:hypothetical protein